ncbi:hypothetical protein RJ45_09465 [Photobacterium gaetbulicola]|uniref:Uncharacterized protein n=1 Tax=Photobacterium gaetbulicola TaxID=1295392 RepID=A0A0B9GYV1_9GAMM|nr:hypothetical protein RJ45_09465 [Photobacterium gaetbulicola]
MTNNSQLNKDILEVFMFPYIRYYIKILALFFLTFLGIIYLMDGIMNMSFIPASFKAVIFILWCVSMMYFMAFLTSHFNIFGLLFFLLAVYSWLSLSDAFSGAAVFFWILVGAVILMHLFDAIIFLISPSTNAKNAHSRTKNRQPY